ncbi:eukaryotic translation initiation factor 3 subunit J [Bombardia bombarda]|uniref:Eukaryotic translation initiation factor 3 subunit J n=1 Tax=Bombardia bombarda TaxID=252184 RepID=A0AA40C1Q4_9PEZI|nr:eukaryotic translation initiation factor 3 subunit J [Bombardia bombarda]
MPGPSKRWEEEEEDSSSSAPDSPAVGAVRRKFDDEEAEDSDVLESWDAAEDSEVEREKAKKAAEAKAKADAEAAAKKKPKTQRIAERLAERARARAEAGESSDEDETEAERRERLRQTEIEADLRHAEDLFSGIGINTRKVTTAANAVVIDSSDPTKTVDLGSLPLFNPMTKTQFELLRNTLIPILGANAKKAHYVMFLQEFTKQLAKDLPSDQIKKVASTLTTLSNERMKEEKAAEKGGKKSKAAKSKTTLVVSRGAVADTTPYDETYGDDDFM